MSEYTLQLGDCLEYMRSMPDKSVDAVITDPPYNFGKDYGVYKDNLSAEEYRLWMRSVLAEARRISRRSVSVFVSSDLRALYSEDMPNAHMVVVEKGAAGAEKDGWAKQYHLIFSEGRPVARTRDLWSGIRLPGEGYYFSEERYDHPGITSLKLTGKMVSCFSMADEIVVDPFMGSGTTGVACMQLGRNFIGCEIEPKYFEIAEKRIKQAASQEVMFA